MRLARAVLPLTILVLLAACGDGSTDTVAGAPASGATDAVPSSTTQDQRAPVSPAPPQAPRRGPLTTPPATRRPDPYLPAGVPDQVFPPGTSAYQLLKNGRCGPLLRQIEGPITEAEAPTTVAWSEGGVSPTLTNLYVAAGEACLARWAPAQAAFQAVSIAELCEVDPSPDSGGVLPPSAASFPTVAACQETRLRVYRWTEGLLEAHDADPAFVPSFPTPPEG